MVDVHCHLNDKVYKGEVDGLIKEATSAGVTTIICAGYSMASSEVAINLAEKFSQVWACVGMGYTPTKINRDNARKRIEKMIKSEKVVGMGEVGLNFYKNMTDDLKKRQIDWLKWQTNIAKNNNLPLIVHCRNAEDEILEILDKNTKVVMHCFTGEKEFMDECVKRDWYISFGGIITFKKNEELREVVRNTPEERILLETDAPYLAPEPIRGSINKPINVKIVAQTAAKVRGVSEDYIERTTTKNAKRVFGTKL